MRFDIKQADVRRLRPALGTLVGIEASAKSEISALAAIDAAFEAIERVAALMHPTAAGSDLSRVESTPVGQTVAVDEWTYAVLFLAHTLHGLTDGVFDPCTPGRSGRMSDLDLSTPGAVTCRAPMALDLGGIAKGFAIDRAVQALAAHGCTAGLINAGGDMRVFGETPRAVIVRSAGGAVVEVEIANAALAVSGPRSPDSPREHRGYYRGGTGAATDGHFVAVTAAEAVLADALTKCAMLCSRATADEVLKRYGARRIDAGHVPYFQASTR